MAVFMQSDNLHSYKAHLYTQTVDATHSGGIKVAGMSSGEKLTEWQAAYVRTYAVTGEWGGEGRRKSSISQKSRVLNYLYRN